MSPDSAAVAILSNWHPPEVPLVDRATFTIAVVRVFSCADPPDRTEAYFDERE